MKHNQLFKILPICVVGTTLMVSIPIIVACSNDEYLGKLDRAHFFVNTTKTRMGEPDLYQHMYKWMTDDINHRLLFIGLDGVRPDAVIKLAKDDSTSIFQQYKSQGETLLGFCGGLDHSQVTSTSPGWTSLLTGEWGTVNGVTTNNADTVLKAGHHTIMNNLAAVGCSTSYSSSQWKWEQTWWTDFDSETSTPIQPNYSFYQDDDGHPDQEIIVNQIKSRIDAGVKANFVILDACDNVGHSSGFSPNNSAYMKALKQNDQDIKNLITEQASVGTSDENLLVVLTTDHGGKGSGHGKFSDEEITTWYALNKNII